MQRDARRRIERVNRFVLNLQADQPFTEAQKARVPTLGALLGGYPFGFRRG